MNSRLGGAFLAVFSTFHSVIWAIGEGNVLVIYNSQSADSQAVRDYYLTARPGVLSHDLADASIVTPTVSYADFANNIRNPIREYLNTNNLAQTVEVIVLTKGIPHRIQSLDPANPNVGDGATNSANAYNAGNATFASVDSELSLLQHDLDLGENGGNHDSAADNAVRNPFFRSSAGFSSFPRTSISSGDQVFAGRNLNAYGWWQLGSEVRRGPNVTFTPSQPGDIYLTARLDAATVDDVRRMIDRAQSIAFRRDLDAVIFDGDGRSEPLDRYNEPSDGSVVEDYAEAESLIGATWDRTIRENSTSFVIGQASGIPYSNTTVLRGPIAHLHSYGVNHSGNNLDIRPYLATYAGQLVPGASFSAYESFGARGLNGLGDQNQGQVEEWISSGGTFATGPVWEPFTFGILRSEIFLDRFYSQGFTFVEAAWSAILQLSWQSVVIGDPLAVASFRDSTEYERWVFQQTETTPDLVEATRFASDLDSDGLPNGLEYAFGLDPDSMDRNSPRLPDFQFSTSSRTIDFTLADPVPQELQIVVESSPTLLPSSWTEICSRNPDGTWSGSASGQETTSAEGTEVQIVDVSPSPDERLFYRVRVTEN